MQRFKVQAVERTGLKGSWRANRFFPSNEAVIVVVHDQVDDPPVAPGASAHPFHVGTVSWRAIEDDRKLSKALEGDSLKLEPHALRKQREEFQAAWEGRATAHDHEVAQLKAQLAEANDHAAKLELEQVQAYEKITSLQETIAAQALELEQLGMEAADEAATDKPGENETPTEQPASIRAAKHGKGGKGSEKHS